MGRPAATADPAPGGALRWTHPDGSTVVGRFVEVDPPRRVVFTYGWEDGRMGVPPGSTTVEIDLVEEDGATTVRLVHHGLPPETVADHQVGWAYFLGVLGNPRGPVRWRLGRGQVRRIRRRPAPSARGR